MPNTCTHRFTKDSSGNCLVCPAPQSTHDDFLPQGAFDEDFDFGDLDADQALELLRMLDVQACQDSLIEFLKAGWHVLEASTTLELNWHHELLCNVLQGMFEDWQKAKKDKSFKQRYRNARCNQPPGSLKSRIFSVFFPVWCWLKDPTFSIICLSGNPAVALRDARSARDLIESDWFQETFKPDWKMRHGQDAIGNYATTKGGTRVSQQAGVKITGIRADAIILDDPNDPYGSESEAIRNKVNGLWNENVANRLNDMSIGLRFIVQQRTHEEDLSGFTATQAAEIWLDVILPAEFELARRCTTPWGSDPRIIEGESIHPARFNEEVLATEKKRFGAYQYAGQMQQRPAPLAGGVIQTKFWHYWRYPGMPLQSVRSAQANRTEAVLLPKFGGKDGARGSEIIITADLGAKGEREHDNTAFIVIGISGPDRYILEIIAKPMYYPEQKATLLALKKKWPTARRTLIEDTSNGTPIISDLKPVISGLIPFKIKGVDNENRIMSMIPEIESGNVYVLDGVQSTADLLDEAGAFPNGRRDDRLVALAQALIYYRESDDVRHARAVNSAWASLRNRSSPNLYRL